MAVLTVTARGQVTLNRALLEHLGVRPGDRISVVPLPGGRIELSATRKKGRISDVFGSLKPKDGKRLSIAGIGRVARRGWAREP